MTVVLAVEVTTNVTHINPQQTNPLKWQKRMAYISWSFERGKGRKTLIRPYKQRPEERFETMEIQNYGERETNNNGQQNKHVIVPDTQYVPNQVEENVSNSLRYIFFLHGQGVRKAS